MSRVERYRDRGVDNVRLVQFGPVLPLVSFEHVLEEIGGKDTGEIEGPSLPRGEP